jgi:hypothetical protein
MRIIQSTARGVTSAWKGFGDGVTPSTASVVGGYEPGGILKLKF